MKKKSTFLSILFAVISTFSFGQYRGELVSSSLEKSLSIDDILSIYGEFNLPPSFIPIEYSSIDIYKVVYLTQAARGDSLILASGLVTFPVNEACDFPLMVYNHGTLMYDEVVSEFTAKSYQHHLGVPFAANGYVVALPDFLGYGETPLYHPHPYMHAKSEATAVVDMLRATRELCGTQNVELNDQLFLLGYSQGGHVTMALHKELETYNTDEFTVTASAPGSGPYDLSGIMRDSMLSNGIYSNPFFIAFTTVSYQYVYQNVYENIDDVFQAPYSGWITKMLDRENPQSNLRDSLPEPGIQMFQPDFLNDITTDDSHPFNENIRDNDVYDWAPLAPVGLFYCTADEKIPYENALFTADTMTNLGADVHAFYAGDYNHNDCTFYAVLGARNWFEQFREGCSIGFATSSLKGESLIQINPNPNRGNFSVILPEVVEHEFSIQTINSIGMPVYHKNIPAHYAGSPLEINLEGQPTGVYFIKVSSGNKMETTRFIVEY